VPPYRKLIAVIEYDESVRKSLQRHLRAAVYRSEGFSSADNFLSIADTCRPACVVSDVNLCGMSGIEFALHPAVTRLDLQIVLITASLDPLVECEARKIAAGFLRKPISGQSLLDIVVDTAGPPIADGDQ